MSEPSIDEIVGAAEVLLRANHSRVLTPQQIAILIASWHAQKAALTQARAFLFATGYATPILETIDAALNPQPVPNAVHGQDG